MDFLFNELKLISSIICFDGWIVPDLTSVGRVGVPSN